jgi:hypothetical protein
LKRSGPAIPSGPMSDWAEMRGRTGSAAETAGAPGVGSVFTRRR